MIDLLTGTLMTQILLIHTDQISEAQLNQRHQCSKDL